jgi:hypothetical protein
MRLSARYELGLAREILIDWSAAWLSMEMEIGDGRSRSVARTSGKTV